MDTILVGRGKRWTTLASILWHFTLHYFPEQHYSNILLRARDLDGKVLRLGCTRPPANTVTCTLPRCPLRNAGWADLRFPVDMRH